MTIMAVALASAVCLPLSADEGTSLLRVILRAIHDDWLTGLMLGVVIAAPHGFGAAAVFASRTGGPYGGAMVRAWVALLQTEVVIVGLLALRAMGDGNVRAPLAIIGFAAVSLLFFVYRVASPSVPDHRRDTGFFVRWGALLTAGMFGWFELQWLGGGSAPGLWLHGTLAAAFALAASVPRNR